MKALYLFENERVRKLFEILRDNAFEKVSGLPEPDLSELEQAVLDVPKTTIEDCLCYLDWAKANGRNGYFDVLHDLLNFYRRTPDFDPRLCNWRNRERNTFARHVWNILAEVRDSGELRQFDAIADYLLPVCNNTELAPHQENTLMTSYHFEDRFEIVPGASEGIYLHWRIAGRFRQEQAPGSDFRLHICTIKTLHTDRAAYKIMGEAGGILEYCAMKYVTNNLKLYTPDAESKENP